MTLLPASVRDDERYNGRLEEISTLNDIPEEWRGTPIEHLIAAENLRQPIPAFDQPQLLIATCIEYRYTLPIPRLYAYVLRRASGRLVGSEFSLAYIFSRGVRHIALIGHNDCGMTKVHEHAHAMVDALVEQGWNRERAEEYIAVNAARHAINNELDALEREYKRLKRLFRNVTIAPLLACLSDTRLYLPSFYRPLYLEEQRRRPDESPEVQDHDLLTLP